MIKKRQKFTKIDQKWLKMTKKRKQWKNYKEHLIDVKKINWSYPKELIEESSKADIVFSY